MNKCAGCSKCCEWAGILDVSNEEASKIAMHIKMDRTLFIKEYLEQFDGGYIMRSNAAGACIF